MRQHFLLDFAALQDGLLAALEIASDARDVLALGLPFLELSILLLLLEDGQFCLFGPLDFFEVGLQHLHLRDDRVVFGDLGQLEELEDAVDVGFDFDELAGRVRLVGALSSLFVADHLDFGDVLDHHLVDALAHQVLASLGRLHFQLRLLHPNFERAVLVFSHAGG